MSTCSATAAWLVWSRHNPETREPARLRGDERGPPVPATRSCRPSGVTLAPVPEVVDPQRKVKAEADFRFFCEAYFPQTFSLPWSDDHLKVIAKIEQAVLRGGLFAMAMPRGSGKTTLAETALHLGDAYGRPGVRLPDRLGRRACPATCWRASRSSSRPTTCCWRDYPEAVFPDSCPRAHSQPGQGPALQRPAHTDCLDGRRDLSCRRSPTAGRRARSSVWPASRAASAA